jgi:hypothetical protein
MLGRHLEPLERALSVPKSMERGDVSHGEPVQFAARKELIKSWH